MIKMKIYFINRKAITIFLVVVFILLLQSVCFAQSTGSLTNVAPDISGISAELESNTVDVVIATDYQGARLDQVKSKATQLEQRARTKGVDLKVSFLTDKKEIVNQTVTRKVQDLVRYVYVNMYEVIRTGDPPTFKSNIPIEYDFNTKFEQDIYDTPSFPKGEPFAWTRRYGGGYGAGDGFFRTIYDLRYDYDNNIYENWFQMYIPMEFFNPNNKSGTNLSYDFITQNDHTYKQSYYGSTYLYPDYMPALLFYSMDVTCPAQWSVKSTSDRTYNEKVEAIDFSKLNNTVRDGSRKYLMLLTDSKRDISFQFAYGNYYPFGNMKASNAGEFCEDATAYILAPNEVMDTKMTDHYSVYKNSGDKQDLSLKDILSKSSANKVYSPSEIDSAFDNLLANALPKGKKVDVVIATNYQNEKLASLNSDLNTMKVNALEKGIDIQTYVLNNEMKIGTRQVFAPKEIHTRNINITYDQQIYYQRTTSSHPVTSSPRQQVTRAIPYETCEISSGGTLPNFSKSTNYTYTISEQKVDYDYIYTTNWGTVVNKIERYYELEIFDPNNKAATLVTYRLDSELTLIDFTDGGRNGFQGEINNIRINSVDTEWKLSTPYNKEYTADVSSVNFSAINSLGIRENSQKYMIYLCSEGDLPEYGDTFDDYYGFGTLTKAAYDSYMGKYDLTTYVVAPEPALDMNLSDASSGISYTAVKQDLTLRDILHKQAAAAGMYYDPGSLKTALDNIVFVNGKHSQNKIDIVAVTDYTGSDLTSLSNRLTDIKNALSLKGYDVSSNITDGASSKVIGNGEVPDTSINVFQNGTVAGASGVNIGGINFKDIDTDEYNYSAVGLAVDGKVYVRGRYGSLVPWWSSAYPPSNIINTYKMIDTLPKIKDYIVRWASNSPGWVTKELFLGVDGNVYGFGDFTGWENNGGSNIAGYINTFTALRNTGKVTQLAYGDMTTFIVEDGNIYSSGYLRPEWTRVEGLGDVKKICVQGQYILALCNDNSLYQFEYNYSFPLYLPEKTVPIPVSVPSGVKDAALAYNTIYAVGNDGNLYRSDSWNTSTFTKINEVEVSKLLSNKSGKIYALCADGYLYNVGTTLTKTDQKFVVRGNFNGVNTEKVLAAAAAGRTGADKIYITALKGEGNLISTPYGSYYGFGNLSQGFVNELANKKVTTYTVTSRANLDYKMNGAGMSLPVQNATLRDITKNSAYGGGQNLDTLEQLKMQIIDRYKPYKTGTGQTLYMILGESLLSTDILALDFEHDPLYAEQWKIASHDPGVFENNQGVNAIVGQYVNSLENSLNKVGKYEITGRVQDNPKNTRAWWDLFGIFRKWSGDSVPVTVYVHRRPVAKFSASIVKNGSNYNVTINDMSYDMDHASAADKGIVQYKWQYKLQSSSSWIDGLIPPQISYDNKYDLKLSVKDREGAWSLPYQIKIDTTDLPPAIDANPTAYTGCGPLNITITANDNGENDLVLAGSSLSPRTRYAVTTSTTKPVSGWTDLPTKVYSLPSITTDGTYYLHMEAYDASGQSFYRVRGPYAVETAKAGHFYITMMLDPGWRSYYFDTGNGIDDNHDGVTDRYPRKTNTDIGTQKMPVNYYSLVGHPQTYIKAGYMVKGKIELLGEPDSAEFHINYLKNGKIYTDRVPLIKDSGNTYSFQWTIPLETDNKSFVSFDLEMKKGSFTYGNEKWEDVWDSRNTSRLVFYVKGKATDDLIYVQSQ